MAHAGSGWETYSYGDYGAGLGSFTNALSSAAAGAASALATATATAEVNLNPPPYCLNPKP